MKQDLEQLKKYLAEQLDFLELSCKSFDNGFIHEAKRLATTLRVLVHDTKSSKSLLSQLQIKNNLGFIDTCLDLNPKNLLPHNGILLTFLTDSGANYVAPLDSGVLGMRHSKGFDTWWNKIVFAENIHKGYSRKDLVLQLANKEGGAHVDPKLDKKFNELHNGVYFNTVFVKDSTEEPIPDAPAYAVRQIAFELLKSIELNNTPNNLPTTLEFISKPKPIVQDKKVGRNELCPCGSGKKYKYCCK